MRIITIVEIILLVPKKKKSKDKVGTQIIVGRGDLLASGPSTWRNAILNHGHCIINISEVDADVLEEYQNEKVVKEFQVFLCFFFHLPNIIGHQNATERNRKLQC